MSPAAAADVADLVSVELEVGGDLKVRPPKDPDGDPQKVPMSVVGTLKYAEQALPGSTLAHTRVIRKYHEAQAVIKLGETGLEPTLADDRRVIVVDVPVGRATLYSPAGPLDRRQLDLIDIVGNSAAIDRLLPAAPVDDADSWPQDADTMAALLGLDAVGICEVQSVLEKTTPKYLQVRLAGTVHGTVDGAATEIEIRGVYLFSRTTHRISRLNLAVRENRSVGDATPGLEVVAKLQLKRDALTDELALGDDAIAEALTADRQQQTQLVYEAPKLGVRMMHDRHWFVISEERTQISLRRVVEGELLAHSTLTHLPYKSEGRQTTFEQFQKDIQFSLKDQSTELVRANEWTNPHGHRCFGVVVRGAVKEVPIEWHYYLVAPESGHRVSLAVTMEGPKAKRLGEADRELVDALELVPVAEQTIASADDAAESDTAAIAEAEAAEETIEPLIPVQRRGAHRRSNRISTRPGGRGGRR